jgi:hypothetical protein
LVRIGVLSLETTGENEMYINTFPGSIYNDAEIFISGEPRYGMQRADDFINSVAVGCTASAEINDVKTLISGGPVLDEFVANYDFDDFCIQEIIENINSLI